MSKSIEKEIRVGYEKLFNYMLLKKGVDLRKLVSPEDINAVMKQINNARMLNLDLDTFTHMCKYLSPSDIVKIVVLSKKLIDKYYKTIWSHIQTIHYPNSIIPNNNYIDIRHAISLDHYYCQLQLKKHYTSFDVFDIFHSDEKQIIDESKFNSQLIIDLYDGIEYHKEMHAFLTLFRFNSISYQDGTKSFTLKSAVDCRLYGFDPINDPVETEIKRKWITGEYNEDSIYFDGDTEYTFIYETLYYDSDFRYEAVGPGKMIKWRKRPYYC